MTATSQREEEVASSIVHCAYEVHRRLGPGLLESVYEACFCYELTKQGLQYRRQVAVPIVYDGVRFSETLRLDVLVEDLVICELKSVDAMRPIFLAQIMVGKRA